MNNVNTLQIKPIVEKRLYELVKGYNFEIHTKYGKVYYEINVGFKWDGASIPKIAWSTFYSPFDPIILEPSLIHDWFYRNHKVTRKQADDLFYLTLKINKVPKIKAKIMYRIVRIFGNKRWKNT